MQSGCGGLWCLFPLSERQDAFAHVCVIFALTSDVGAGGWEHSEEAYGVCVSVSVCLNS